MNRTAYILLYDFNVEVEGIDGPYHEWLNAPVSTIFLINDCNEIFAKLPTGETHRVVNPIDPKFYEINTVSDKMATKLFIRCKEDEIEDYRGTVLGTKLNIV